MSGKSDAAVIKVYDECGITDPFQLPLETIITSKNIIIKEEKIEGAEGRIVMTKNSGIITLNSDIDLPGKKRFILAHELGHFEMHRNLSTGFNETDQSLNHWYHKKLNPLEVEANEFAAEFLMPTELFQNECKGKIFNHKVIAHLANRFQVSKTAAILKFVKKDNGNHPIFVVCCQDNKMKWFKKSDDFYHYSLFESNLPPPPGSVSHEVFEKGIAYYGEESTQPIWKSDWFVMKDDEPESAFFEYCLFVKSFNYMISVIWER
jgi:Zn-dependent peptidase ImmA (M78 family)